MIKCIDGRVFYVGELVKCKDDTWFRPLRWVLSAKDQMYAVGEEVTRTQVSVLSVLFQTILRYNYNRTAHL